MHQSDSGRTIAWLGPTPSPVLLPQAALHRARPSSRSPRWRCSYRRTCSLLRLRRSCLLLRSPPHQCRPCSSASRALLYRAPEPLAGSRVLRRLRLGLTSSSWRRRPPPPVSSGLPPLRRLVTPGRLLQPPPRLGRAQLVRPDTPGLLSVSRRAGRRPGRLLCLAPRRLPGLLSASLRAGCAAPGAGSAKPRPAPAHHHARGPRSWLPATPSPPSASLRRAGLPACVARLLSIALAAAGRIRLASAGIHPRPELGLPSPAPLGPASVLSAPAPPRQVLRAGPLRRLRLPETRPASSRTTASPASWTPPSASRPTPAHLCITPKTARASPSPRLRPPFAPRLTAPPPPVTGCCAHAGGTRPPRSGPPSSHRAVTQRPASRAPAPAPLPRLWPAASRATAAGSRVKRHGRLRPARPRRVPLEPPAMADT
nr:formin-2-like [Aegilops tauschii subsp. strangulata]